MADTLLTDRLALDPWTDADIAILARLAGTPAVVRHIGDGLTWSEVKVAEVSAHNVEHWRVHGFGWRVARPRAGGPAIGFVGLSFAGEGAGVDPGEHEIGWWLEPSAWGRGLAREGAAAVRDEAFGPVSAPSVLARIQPANAASLAVARAIGLRYRRDIRGRAGEPAVVLALSAAGWRARRRSARPPAPA